MTELTREEIEWIRNINKIDRIPDSANNMLKLCDLALEALNQREQGEWQPIESAPRDGRVFWACRPSLTEESGYWVALMKFWDGHFIDGNGKAYEPHFWKPNTEKPTPPAKETSDDA